MWNILDSIRNGFQANEHSRNTAANHLVDTLSSKHQTFGWDPDPKKLLLNEPFLQPKALKAVKISHNGAASALQVKYIKKEKWKNFCECPQIFLQSEKYWSHDWALFVYQCIRHMNILIKKESTNQRHL